MRTTIFCLLTVACCCDARAQVQQPLFGSTSVSTSVSAPSFGGIAIDASGLVSSPANVRVNAALERKRLKESAHKNLPGDMSLGSKLRKVSLVGLEQELKKIAAAGGSIPASIQYLAGMTQIEYVFADRESGDLIIAGPAEGFAATTTGAVVGTDTGRPVLLLDDLLVMLRLPDMGQTLGCSFDPDKARLANAQAWFQQSPAAPTVAKAKKQFRKMAEVLGNYDVRIFGLPQTSHAAFRMVDADYQMKRINLGLRRTGIRGFKSQLAMMRADDNSMRRYWFAPRYEQIERSVGGDMFRMSGARLQLLSQEELVDAKGNRTKASFSELSTEDYTRQFNKYIKQLCERTPAFAAVQNLFDMAIAVALIRQNELMEAARWKPTLLMDANLLPVMQCPAPTEVPAQVNTRTVGRSLIMFQIGGGVKLVPADIIARVGELSPEQTPEISRQTESWWWD